MAGTVSRCRRCSSSCCSRCSSSAAALSSRVLLLLLLLLLPPLLLLLLPGLRGGASAPLDASAPPSSNTCAHRTRARGKK